MAAKSYTIGELARLSGQSVRRIRFYSDNGLLPPSVRSLSNYRMYTDTDLAKLDLIRSLREIGVSLEVIRRLLSRQLSLHDVLSTRLDLLEVEIIAKRRSATAIRAVLRLPNSTDDDLKRIWTMTNLSTHQMKSLVERLVNNIAADTSLSGKWRQQIVEVSIPELPDSPTSEQIAAWDELASMLADPAFVREVREGAKAFWTNALDPEAYQRVSMEAYNAAAEAVRNGISPASASAQMIANKWFNASADAMGRTANHEFLDWHFSQFDAYEGRLGRYRDLLLILSGTSAPLAANREVWRWLNAALKALPKRL